MLGRLGLVKLRPYMKVGRPQLMSRSELVTSPFEGFNGWYQGDSEAEERVAHLLRFTEAERSFGVLVSEPNENMSGSGKPPLRFDLGDIESHMESGVKNEGEQKGKTPLVEKPTGRVKMIKRKKEVDSRIVALFKDKDFDGIGDMGFKVMSAIFKELRDDHRRVEEELIRMKEDIAKEVTEIVDAAVEAVKVEKDREMEAAVDAVKVEMGKAVEAMRVKKDREVAAAVDAAIAEAKDAAALAVLEAKIKIVGEASGPSFDRAVWNVRQWELISEKLMGEMSKKAAMIRR